VEGSVGDPPRKPHAYLFRGRMGGYLTRLSTTGLANVTSGGGQVPAFVVD
jgi:hypothetical protein